MSQIATALNKAQKLRQNNQDQKVTVTDQVGDIHRPVPRDILLVLIAIGTLSAILISIAAIMSANKNSVSKQNKMLSLEQNIQIHEKKINDLFVLFNKTKDISDSQLHDLNLRLIEETEERRVQFGNLALTDSANYNSLYKAILDDIKKIDYLDKYTKSLKQLIEKEE